MMNTRKWLIGILVLAVVAAYIYIGTASMNQRRQTKNLDTELIGLQQVLALIPQMPAGLDQQLTDARAQLAAAESAFTGETDSTTIVDSVLKLADAAGVKGVPLSTQPWSPMLISNRTYSVLHLTLQVTGDFTRLQDFLNRLEHSDIKTLTVSYLKVVRASADDTAPMTADLDIAVYALPETAK